MWTSPSFEKRALNFHKTSHISSHINSADVSGSLLLHQRRYKSSETDDLPNIRLMSADEIITEEVVWCCDDSAERYHVASVHSGCLFSFASSCQQTVAGESAPCRERNHTEKINDWTFVVFCSASLLICTEGGLIYCVLNIALNIYSNAWFTHGIGAIMYLQGNVRFGLLLCSQVSGYTHFHIPSVCRPALKWRPFCKILSC